MPALHQLQDKFHKYREAYNNILLQGHLSIAAVMRLATMLEI